MGDVPPATPLPRSRGQPVLSDLVYGGAGARAAAAAHNEMFDAARTPPLPPYEPQDTKYTRDSESGIGISLDAHSRRSSAVSMRNTLIQDLTSVLATELQESIFKLLDADSLLKATMVSKRWKSLCESQAVWREVFLKRYCVKQANPFLRTRRVPGLGRNTPGQDYKKLYQIRTLIDKRWKLGQAAAIYLNGHKDSVYCVQFDEHKIITGSRDNTIRVWDARTYQCIKKLGPYNNPRERQKLERAAVEPHGILPFFKADVSSPDPAAGPLPHWHQASVLCLQYDDEILVTGSSDYTCLVWSIKENYAPKFRLVGHQAGVLDVCIDGRYIITCSKDTTIKIWDRETGELRQTLMGHRGPVNAVQVRGNLLASASGDGMSKLWRLEDGICIKEFQSKDRGLACVEFSEDGRTIFAGGNDQVIYEYDTITGRRVRELRGHTNLVRSLHLDSANSRIISGSYDHSIKVWDAKQGESSEDGGLKIDFKNWTSSWMLAAKSNYRKIVCTSQDGRVVIIDFGYGIDGVDLVEA
jgi:F-box and WD-40 domain protein 1/11